jgi:hypothetical protein
MIRMTKVRMLNQLQNELALMRRYDVTFEDVLQLIANMKG